MPEKFQTNESNENLHDDILDLVTNLLTGKVQPNSTLNINFGNRHGYFYVDEEGRISTIDPQKQV